MYVQFRNAGTKIAQTFHSKALAMCEVPGECRPIGMFTRYILTWNIQETVRPNEAPGETKISETYEAKSPNA